MATERKTGTPYISLAFRNSKGQVKQLVGVYDAEGLADKAWIWERKRHATVDIYLGKVNQGSPLQLNRTVTFEAFKGMTFEELSK